MEIFTLVVTIALLASAVVIYVAKAATSVVDLVEKVRRLGRRLK